jgi:hypothetical protein
MTMIPGTKEKMLDGRYWIKKLDDPEKVIMASKEIQKFNEETINKVDAVYDLHKYPEALDKNQLLNIIEEYKVPDETRYDIDGNTVTIGQYEKILNNRNLEDIKDINPVQYAVAVKNAPIRSFPTDLKIFKTKEDREFDRFQESGCQALETALILHESLDKKWYFIQTYNYRGWVKAEDFAIGSKDEIFKYADDKDFLVVTGNYIKTQPNPHDEKVSYVEFTMGTRIPYCTCDIPQNVGNQSTVYHYVVKLPVRGIDGKVEFHDALIAKTEDVNTGYLPYTSENILKQVFKLEGHRYGWGDDFHGRDCSSTIMYTYKSFGIRLPRNANQQENGAGITYKFSSSMTVDERISLFKKVKPGAPIYMDGHVMMYIGMDEGIPYMIHEFNGYGVKDGTGFKFVPANEVAVTSTLLHRASGEYYIEDFTTLLQVAPGDTY